MFYLDPGDPRSLQVEPGGTLFLSWGYALPVKDDMKRIFINEDDKARIRKLGNAGDSIGSVVSQLLANYVPDDQYIYDYLLNLQSAVDDAESMTPIDISDLPSRFLSKVFIGLGYKSDGFFDFGIRRTAKTRVATFMGTDEYTTRSMLVLGSLNGLIEYDGVKELTPFVDVITRILVAKRQGEDISVTRSKDGAAILIRIETAEQSNPPTRMGETE
jgi:hypothetical protein